MSLHIYQKFVVCAGLWVASALLCEAQSETMGSLQGKALDPARGPIAGARITAVPEGSAAGRSTVSDQDGRFSLPLEPGKYTLGVAKDGFIEASQSIQFPLRGSGRIDIVLQIAPVQVTVTVTENAGYRLETSSTATKTLTPLRDV